MLRNRFFGIAVMFFVITLMLINAGCFSSTGINPTNTTPAASTSTASPTTVKPAPVISSLVATTSGYENDYYATLDIKIKNNGAEGIVEVTGSVTQNNSTKYTRMPVYLMDGEEDRVKMTFPLVWGAGEFIPKATVEVP